MTLETLSSALGSEAESWGCFEDIPSPIEATLDDMEDELLVGSNHILPDHFSQSREFDLLQDDFLDLAGDESQHSADMALCLQTGASSVPPSLSSKDELRSSSEAATAAATSISSSTSETQLDNPSMKLENLDSWDQDVLLSNAGLPETNPLLLDQDLDNSVSEDFQKMLNEWENHIGSLQTTDIPEVDLMVPSEVANNNSTSATTNTTTTSLSSSSSSSSSTTSNVIEHNPQGGLIKLEDKQQPLLLSSHQQNPLQTTLQTSTIRDDHNPFDISGGQKSKMTLGQMALAGIVISSGPGDHFETYEVLEATDTESLLDQFEEETSLADNNAEYENPKKTSNIFKAVKNHFAASGQVNPKRNPRIVPSQRIKDVLPKEIIERIRKSSQKSRTIAIIEPVQHDSPKPNDANSNKPITKPSNISKSHIIQPPTTRFQEAANSLNKTKHLRLLSSTQQVQVSLDHDYCSSLAKLKRGHHHHQHHHHGQHHRPNHHIISASSTSMASPRPLIRVQPSGSNTTVVTKPSSIVVSSPMTSKSIVRVNPEASVITMPIAVEVASAASGASASSPLSSPARKDSGLESGEASDASDSHSNHATSMTSSGSSCDLYSKVPSYLTTVNVMNSDSCSVTTEEDPKSYDRLPAYVKGVPRRIVVNTTSTGGSVDSNSNSSNNPSSAASSSDLTTTTTTCVVRKPRRSNSSSSSSSNSSEDAAEDDDHSSTEISTSKSDQMVSSIATAINGGGSVNNRMATRSRTSIITSSTTPSSVTAASTASSSSSSVVVTSSGAVRRRRQSSSSSSSSSSSEMRSPRQKKRRSWRKPSSNVYDSTDHLRSRSPDQPPREVQRRKQRQVEERRVVYVGRITEGITRADLRKRFETFGPIEEISVHFRDRGDNYGFVTFRNKADAFAAIEQGNDDTSYPKVDLCFGGRRTFCKEKYSDLDSRSLHTVGSTSRRSTALADDDVEQQSEKVSTRNDFDTLLKRARAGIRNNK